MPNPNPVTPEGFIKTRYKRSDGTEPLAKQAIALRLPTDIDSFVRSQPDTAAWIRATLREKMELTSVGLDQRKTLPNTCAIYFVTDSDGSVLYIGQAGDLQKRWGQHHQYKNIKDIPDVRIAWIEVSDKLLLPVIEKALIEWFNPPLNNDKKSLKNLIDRSAPDNPGETVTITVRVAKETAE